MNEDKCLNVVYTDNGILMGRFVTIIKSYKFRWSLYRKFLPQPNRVSAHYKSIQEYKKIRKKYRPD